MKHVVLTLAIASLALTGCDNKSAAPDNAGNGNGATAGDPPAGDHGALKPIGDLALAGKNFHIAQEGDLIAGKECAFDVLPKDFPASELADLQGFVWLEDKDGNELCPPAAAEREEAGFHFHVTPKEGSTPATIVLRIRAGETDERGSLPLP